jgi:thiamine biosynthesis lipoprotein
LAAAPIASARWSCWGGTAVVAVRESHALAAARRAVEETIEAFDAACSRFRPDSELARVNAAAGSAVAIGPVLHDAVGAALRAARLTDGDVDPTVGTALIALGYDRDFDELRPPSRVSFAAVAGWRTVVLDTDTMRLAPGVSLDLGATAKALAADRAAEAARAAAGCGALVSLSGDIAVAGEPPDGGWPIRVTDDHRSALDVPGQSITIAGGGLATSSTTVRRWQAGGNAVHHVVDPRTGAPVDGVWRTVSVTAASCLDANIASTAALVRGSGAASWLSSLGLAARLVSVDGVATHIAGWPADGEELPS